MTVKTMSCHTLTCDGCGEPLNPGDEGELHFSTAAEARSDATQYYEWTLADDRDLCPACTAVAQCAENGHVPALDMDGKFCDRCEEEIA